MPANSFARTTADDGLSDPGFTNLAGDDYSLTENSLAVNAGVDVGVTEDILGNPRPQGSAPDIGAFEYVLIFDTTDINNDGAVNIQDVQLCVNVILGTETNPEIAARADVNEDGDVNVLDLQMIANMILNQ